MTETDVVIAGGGIAGATAAAALAGLGYGVLIVEPGLDNTRRLAGELIHPPGTAHLKELGLLSALVQAGGVPVQGFAVFAAEGGPYLLSYTERDGVPRQGLAIEHATLAGQLLRTVERLPQITVWKDARVTAIDLSDNHHATATVTCEGSESRLQARLLIAADGRNSHVRRMAGINHKQVHLSNMMGYAVNHGRLPHPGFGHVFANGPAPALAYEVSAGTTRIMFDLPMESGDKPRIGALPEPFRSDVEQAAATQTPLYSGNYSIIPETVTKGSLVCVGDAGGSCHPLSATGLSACTRDAMLLRHVLREMPGDIPLALQRYASLRAQPQRTRLSGAEVLYEVFKGQTPEMRLLRQGLFRYWENSPRGRAATMALLSTEESRTSALMSEYFQVYRYALAGGQSMVGLSRALVKFALSAVGK